MVEPGDPSPDIPAHLDEAAPASTERAADAPPARPWRPNPNCTEIPAHLIRAALRHQGANSPEEHNQAQRREIAHAVSRRFGSVQTGGPANPTADAGVVTEPTAPAHPLARAPAA